MGNLNFQICSSNITRGIYKSGWTFGYWSFYEGIAQILNASWLQFGEKIMKIQNFLYLAFPVTFKFFLGLFQFFWDIWHLRSPVVCKNPISKHNFIPNHYVNQISHFSSLWWWGVICPLPLNRVNVSTKHCIGGDRSSPRSLLIPASLGTHPKFDSSIFTMKKSLKTFVYHTKHKLRFSQWPFWYEFVQNVSDIEI